MAKSIKQFITTDLTDEVMDAARKQALAKKARMVAEQELGISDSTMPVIKGPAKVPNELMCSITVDLAEFTDRIFLDGKWYMHGRTYTVPQRVYDSMKEIISNTWRHQEEIDGKDRNFYRKSKTVALSPAAA